MDDVAALRWDVDDLEGAEGLEDDAPLVVRAKPVVRRGKIVWAECDGVSRATIGRFNVWVGVSPGSSRWEWCAFAPGPMPRALRCKGFVAREEALGDAEAVLSAVG